MARRTRDSRGGVFGDDIQAFHHARNNLVLEPGVQVFRVLAENCQVHRYVRKPRLEPGKHPHGTGIEAEFLAQLNVDALVAAADGCGGRAFESDTAHLKGGENLTRQQRAVFFERIQAGFDALPFDFHAGGIYRAHRRFCNFWANAVAWDEGYLMGHSFYYKGGGAVGPELGSRAPQDGGDADAPPWHSR